MSPYFYFLDFGVISHTLESNISANGYIKIEVVSNTVPVGITVPAPVGFGNGSESAASQSKEAIHST